MLGKSLHSESLISFSGEGSIYSLRFSIVPIAWFEVLLRGRGRMRDKWICLFKMH
jgi:hypothetical protein